MVLNVTIENRIATLQDFEGEFVCGNSEDTVMFNFDDEWANYPNRTARFKWNGEYKDVDFTGDTVNIPPIKNAKVIRFGVYSGESAEGENEISTTEVKIPCLLCTRCGGERANGSIGENYTNEARGYAAEAKASALSAKESEEATADMGAEVQAHQAYYDSMVHAEAAGAFDEGKVWIVAEGSISDDGGAPQTASVLVLPNGLSHISEFAHQSANLNYVRFPVSLESIYENSFDDARLMGHINIPRNVDLIGEYAFRGNLGLTSVTFAEDGKLEQIAEGAFSGTGIVNVKIPKSVTWIGAGAFALAEDRTMYIDLTAYGYDAPFPSIGGYIYTKVYGCTVYVPKGRKAELLSLTNWATGDYIVREEEV